MGKKNKHYFGKKSFYNNIKFKKKNCKEINSYILHPSLQKMFTHTDRRSHGQYCMHYNKQEEAKQHYPVHSAISTETPVAITIQYHGQTVRRQHQTLICAHITWNNTITTR